ncbi:EF-hand calcium-binding domain-containing protein 5 [Quaeritorhiza haematococci]|nr:EF-hand calcium-binding domain-containing protein 5 [Quaeritorhiza haematococci]
MAAKISGSNVSTGWHELAFNMLAHDFLEVSESNMEVRAYMADTTLPTVILALDKLLREVDRRNILSTESIEADSKDAFAPAADFLDYQFDKPPNSFDPLNWLAQYLYRNNPRYSNFVDSSASPYLKGLQAVSAKLKSKLFELDTIKQARRRQEELNRKQQELQQNLQKAALEKERNRSFTELLTTIFRKWCLKLWRGNPGFLSHGEIVDGFQKVSEDTSLDDKVLHEKFNELVRKLAQIHENGNPHTEKWDLAQFVDLLTDLMHSWTVDELNKVLQILSVHVEEEAEKLRQAFDKIFYVPIINEVDIEDDGGLPWKRELAKLLRTIDPNDEWLSLTAEKAFSDFLIGDSDSPDAKTRSDTEAEFRIWVKKLIADHGIQPFLALFRYLSNQSACKRLSEKSVEAPAETPAETPTEVPQQPSPSESNMSQSHLSSKDTRNARVAKLFNLLDKEKANDILVRKLNSMIDAGLTKVQLPIPLQQVINDIKLPVTPRTLLTKRVLREEFVAHVCEVCLGLTDEQFDIVLNALTIIFGGDEVGNPRPSETKNVKPQLSPEERSKVQSECLKTIRELGYRVDLNMGTLLNIALEAVTASCKKLYPHEEFAVLRGRICLLESLPHGDKQIEEEGSDSVTKALLRYIACLNETVAVGQYADEGSHDHSIHQAKAAQKTQVERASSNGEDKLTDVIGIPFIESDTRCVGVFVLTSQMKDANLTESDMDYLKLVADELLKVMKRNDARNKTFALIKASKRWITETQPEIEVYVNLIENVENESILYEVEELPEMDVMDDAHSPFLRPLDVRLKRVEKGASNEFLWKCLADKQLTQATDEEGRNVAAIPIFDDANNCVAIMNIRAKQSDTAILELEETQKVAAILGEGVIHVNKETLAGDDLRILDGEGIDEEARREMLFPRMMLLHARECLGKLDPKAISELRSYKKPPVIIHRVIKATLYIFGYRPPEVKRWADAIKFVNLDLMKKMIEYDPTAVQKKIRIKRSKRALKNVTSNDVKKRGSQPAQFMYDWLTVSLELYTDAVRSRKRRADLFAESQESLSEREGTADEMGEEEEEEDTATSNESEDPTTTAASDDQSAEQTAGMGSRPSTSRRVKFLDEQEQEQEASSEASGVENEAGEPS